jgi:hypothetical protein
MKSTTVILEVLLTGWGENESNGTAAGQALTASPNHLQYAGRFGVRGRTVAKLLLEHGQPNHEGNDSHGITGMAPASRWPQDLSAV